MSKPSNWFHRTILEDDEDGKSGIQVLYDKRKAIMKMWIAAWAAVLIMVFTLLLIVRLALAIPLF